jgi:hypothetical protein
MCDEDRAVGRLVDQALADPQSGESVVAVLAEDEHDGGV